MDRLQVSFAQWLKQRRKALDLTQKSLALCVGCSPKTIEKIETGERRPSRQIAELLLACVQVPYDERPSLLAWARWHGFSDRPVQESALPRLPQGPNNLPALLTSFIGRKGAIQEIRTLLRKSNVRLITLTGPPGIGKTRLSLEVGAALLSGYKDGVFFVPLASVREESLVASTIARELQVRESGSRSIREMLKAHLSEKEMLLILDNFEQVVEAAPLVTELLAASPGLQVLATSREVLYVYGEHTYALAPLQMPRGDYATAFEPSQPDGEALAHDALEYEAVRLFVERAAAARHDFELQPEDIPTIIAICMGLDGLPLAIELAAARVAHATIKEIRTRLQHKLDLLVTGLRDMTPRQRTLRGAIEWSYDLLDEDEKRLFRRLSIFAGGSTAEAIAEVCSVEQSATEDEGRRMKDSLRTFLDSVRSLHDKSLVEMGRERGDRERFRMLETIREYAWEMLNENGERDAMQERHAAYFLNLAEAAEPMLNGPDQLRWLDRLTDEHDNMRSALKWLLQRDVEAALRMSGSLAVFWYRRGHLSEGRSYLSAALERGASVPASIRGKALNNAGTLAYAQGDFEEARSFYTRSLDAHSQTGDRKLIARSLNNLGLIAGNQSDYPTARRLYNESLTLWQELDDKAGIALTLNNLMTVALAEGEYEDARIIAQESVKLRGEIGDKAGLASSLSNLSIVLFALEDYQRATALQEDSLAIRREIGDRHGVANCLLNLGELARYRGDLDLAERLCAECLQICRELGDKLGICNALVNLGLLAHARGETDRAEEYFRESLEVLRSAGDRRSMVQGLVGLAAVAASRNEVERAARLLGAANSILEDIGAQMYPHERRDYERTLAAVRPHLGDSQWQAAWQRGGEMSLEDINYYALERPS